MCGNCKKYASELMEKILIDITEKRKTVEKKIKDYLI
jgi:tryptophanyl-tRNA synthetase